MSTEPHSPLMEGLPHVAFVSELKEGLQGLWLSECEGGEKIALVSMTYFTLSIVQRCFSTNLTGGCSAP